MYFQMKTIMVWYLRYFSYQKDPKRPQFQSNTSDLLNLPGIFLKRSSSFFSYVYVMFMLMLNLNKILKTKFNSNVSLMSQIKSFSKIESFIFLFDIEEIQSTRGNMRDHLFHQIQVTSKEPRVFFRNIFLNHVYIYSILVVHTTLTWIGAFQNTISNFYLASSVSDYFDRKIQEIYVWLVYDWSDQTNYAYIHSILDVYTTLT